MMVRLVVVRRRSPRRGKGQVGNQPEALFLCRIAVKGGGRLQRAHAEHRGWMMGSGGKKMGPANFENRRPVSLPKCGKGQNVAQFNSCG